MRLVFVNNAHPDIPHVSGMRIGYFARAMAQRGHHVVLLTGTLPDSFGQTETPEAWRERMSRHDWREPFHLPVVPLRSRTLEWVRGNRLPGPFRRALTLWQMAYHGGVFEDWVAACRPHARRLGEAFRPELVWGTFGNTSNLMLSQYIARQSGCPWVIDIKDNWSTFIRPGLREWLAWRFRDASGFTANAAHHQDIASGWLSQRHTAVIYSGVSDEFTAPLPQAAPAAMRDLILVGGTYDQSVLNSFLLAVKHWLLQLSPAQRSVARFVYAGTDGKRVGEALERVGLPCATSVAGYLPIGELAGLCRQSLANSYLWAPFGFHHKLLELLSCGRPVIAFPGEADESRGLAAQCDTPFSACGDVPALHAALTRAWGSYGSTSSGAGASQWRWSALAAQLEGFFTMILREQAA